MAVHDENSNGAPDVENRRQWTFSQRHGLLLVGLSPVIANVIASIFNILYNQIQIEPWLTDAQHDRFHDCVMVFNVIVYPIAITCFVVPLLYLRPTHRALLRGDPVDPERLCRECAGHIE